MKIRLFIEFRNIILLKIINTSLMTDTDDLEKLIENLPFFSTGNFKSS